MKPEYLGDCLDFYKRWFLAEFFPCEQLVALPMLTEAWSPSDCTTYSNLINVRVVQEADFPNRADRPDYFHAVIDGEFALRDVFVDPDTGLCLGNRPPRRRRYDEYVFARELQFLCPAGTIRAVVVYDHSISRDSPVEFAEQKVQGLFGMGLYAFAYCAQVAMVVVSRQSDRIAQLHKKASSLAYLPQERLACNVVVKP